MSKAVTRKRRRRSTTWGLLLLHLLIVMDQSVNIIWLDCDCVLKWQSIRSSVEHLSLLVPPTAVCLFFCEHVEFDNEGTTARKKASACHLVGAGINEMKQVPRANIDGQQQPRMSEVHAIWPVVSVEFTSLLSFRYAPYSDRPATRMSSSCERHVFNAARSFWLPLMVGAST